MSATTLVTLAACALQLGEGLLLNQGRPELLQTFDDDDDNFNLSAEYSLKSELESGVDSQSLLWTSSEPIERLLNLQRDINAIIIGANDGNPGSNDPLLAALAKKTNIRALMVEPNPPVFKTLEANLKGFPKSDRLVPIQAAVCADVKGEVSFYRLSPAFAQKCPGAPHWLKYQLSSMNRDHVAGHWRKHFEKNLGINREEFEGYIEEIKVACLTPPDLMSSRPWSSPEKVDLLQVDAEGFDEKIVTAFMSNAQFLPKIVIYEQVHLNLTQQQSMKSLLWSRGYESSGQGTNVLAFLRDAMLWQ